MGFHTIREYAKDKEMISQSGTGQVTEGCFLTSDFTAWLLK
jgi:hypothetical protein